MGRTVEVISQGESFQVDATDRTYQGAARVTAFKVSGDQTPGSAGQVQLAAAPSIAGAIQSTGTGFMHTIFTGAAAPGAVTLAGTKVGDTVVSVLNLTGSTDLSTDFESKISVAGQIQQTGGGNLSGDKFLVFIIHQS